MKLKILEKLNFIQKIIVFSLFTITTMALLIFFVVRPSMGDIKDIKGDIEEQREKLEKKYLMGLNAKILSQNAQEIKNNLETFESMFIPQEGYLDLVTSLERLAQKNYLQEELNILTNNAENKGNYKVVPVHIEVKGAFSDQLAFVSDLKNEVDYQFNINSLRFRSEDPAALSSLKTRSPREKQKRITTTTKVEIEGEEVTTTKEVIVGENETTTPQKNISLMILGEVYWKK